MCRDDADKLHKFDRGNLETVHDISTFDMRLIGFKMF